MYKNSLHNKNVSANNQSNLKLDPKKPNNVVPKRQQPFNPTQIHPGQIPQQIPANPQQYIITNPPQPPYQQPLTYPQQPLPTYPQPVYVDPLRNVTREVIVRNIMAVEDPLFITKSMSMRETDLMKSQLLHFWKLFTRDWLYSYKFSKLFKYMTVKSEKDDYETLKKKVKYIKKLFKLNRFLKLLKRFALANVYNWGNLHLHKYKVKEYIYEKIRHKLKKLSNKNENKK